ncbi:hypothetical protein [Catenuloplanes atrovinosus]|uniref:C4-dicarboxylate-specific signal transduction histidine kinase n=1 Tax=Catenuloplanes atrovinosus TaxID=137266 RepID=A0AAE3YUL5_9ACTN|nr:hypothetical protein [Catenuloplanes atrovinosus]MDR7278905.1 C4-dicarboxylate-specific signal transduction histidine kinase [Catenuloplanes atrovinosus]
MTAGGALGLVVGALVIAALLVSALVMAGGAWLFERRRARVLRAALDAARVELARPVADREAARLLAVLEFPRDEVAQREERPPC